MYTHRNKIMDVSFNVKKPTRTMKVLDCPYPKFLRIEGTQAFMSADK